MSPSVHKALRNAVLLCIDDNRDVLECEKAFLETFGYTVLRSGGRAGSLPPARPPLGFGFQLVARGVGRQNLPLERGWRDLRGESRAQVRDPGRERYGGACAGYSSYLRRSADRPQPTPRVGHRPTPPYGPVPSGVVRSQRHVWAIGQLRRTARCRAE